MVEMKHIIEALKQFIGKSISVLGTYVIANNVLPILFEYFAGVGSANPIQIKLLLLGAAYSIWIKAVIPFVDELYNSIKMKYEKKATNVGPINGYFELI